MQNIGRLSDFREGTISQVACAGGDLVIVRDGESLHAFAAHCPHAGAPLVVEGVRTSDDGGIVVDSTLRAGDGLYVVGDCASFPFYGEQVRIEHWRVAQQHGRIVAANIAHMSQHNQIVPFFWTYHFGKNVEYIGHPNGWDRVHLDGDLEEQNFIALQLRSEHVVGVIACQREHTTAILVERMREPLHVSEALDLLRA